MDREWKIPYYRVVKNMVTRSPYDQAKQTLFYWIPRWGHMNNVNIRVNAEVNMHDALAKISVIFKKFDPQLHLSTSSLMKSTQRNLRTKNGLENWLPVLPVSRFFISCLGLFGMASFTARNVSRRLESVKYWGQCL